jgi:hypothetical protein
LHVACSMHHVAGWKWMYAVAAIGGGLVMVRTAKTHRTVPCKARMQQRRVHPRSACSSYLTRRVG